MWPWPAERVSVSGPRGANAVVKFGCLAAGMAAGTVSIDDMDVLRHGAKPEVFGGVGRRPRWDRSCGRSPGATWRQLGKVSRDLLAVLARRAASLPGADQLALVDVDSMQRRVYGHSKHAAFEHTKIQGKTVLVRGALEKRLAAPAQAAEAHARRMLEIEEARAQAEDFDRRRRWLADISRLVAGVLFKAAPFAQPANAFRCQEQIELGHMIAGISKDDLEADVESVRAVANASQGPEAVQAAQQANLEIESLMRALTL